MADRTLRTLADTTQAQQQSTNLRRVLEPHQLGVGTPDGIVIIARVMRGWVNDIQWKADNVGTPDGVVNSDLGNVFGLMVRSEALKSAHETNKGIALRFANKWEPGYTVVWARMEDGAWRLVRVKRGDIQGSQLSAIAFVCNLKQPVDEVEANTLKVLLYAMFHASGQAPLRWASGATCS